MTITDLRIENYLKANVQHPVTQICIQVYRKLINLFEKSDRYGIVVGSYHGYSPGKALNFYLTGTKGLHQVVFDPHGTELFIAFMGNGAVDNVVYEKEVIEFRTVDVIVEEVFEWLLKCAQNLS